MSYDKRALSSCLLFALLFCLGARAQQTQVVVNFGGIELLENDHGWKVEASGESFPGDSPFEKGDEILKIGGQDVEQLGPLSIAASLEHAQLQNLGMRVARGGQEMELSFHPSSVSGSEGGSQQEYAIGATITSVEDTERIIVTDVLPGSPAERKGLKSGDELLALGGRAVSEMRLGQLADALSTPRESAERLRIRRGSREMDITLKRINSEDSLRSSVPQRMPFPLHIRSERAPDFSLSDLRGRRMALSNFRGKPVLLTFWGTWCGPCVAEADLFDKLQRELGPRLIVLALDVADDPEVLQHFLQSRPLSYSILVAGEFTSPIPKTYDLDALPLTVVIDPDGFITYLQRGFSPDSPLESRVRSLVGQSTGK